MADEFSHVQKIEKLLVFDENADKISAGTVIFAYGDD